MPNTDKVVASFPTLMRYAKAVGDAKRSGDPQAIAEAESQLRAYERTCLEADEMSLGMTYGALDSGLLEPGAGAIRKVS